MINVINNVIAGGCFESVLFFASVFSSVLPFLQCIAVYSVYSPVYYLFTGTLRTLMRAANTAIELKTDKPEQHAAALVPFLSLHFHLYINLHIA